MSLLDAMIDRRDVHIQTHATAESEAGLGLHQLAGDQSADDKAFKEVMEFADAKEAAHMARMKVEDAIDEEGKDYMELLPKLEALEPWVCESEQEDDFEEEEMPIESMNDLKVSMVLKSGVTQDISAALNAL